MQVTRSMKHWLALGVLFQVCQSAGLEAGSIPKPRPRIPFQAVQPGKGVFLVAKQGMLDPGFAARSFSWWPTDRRGRWA